MPHPVRAVLLAATLLAPAAYAADPVSIHDLTRVVRFSDPVFAPDGRTLVALEGRAELEHDEYHTELIAIDVASHAKRNLTHDRHHVAAPRFTPDGTALAFLAPDTNHVPQIFIMPLNGGDPLKITDAKDGVDQYAFTPDGKTIIYAATDPAPDLKGTARFNNGFEVHNDDYTLRAAPRPAHLWRIASTGGEAARLTSGTWSLPTSLPPGPPSSPIQISPDGKTVYFVKQISPSTGDQLDTQIERLDLASGKFTPLTGATRLEAYPVLSPDGATVAYWKNRDDKPWQFQDAWLAPAAGGPGRDLTAALDKNLYLTRWLPDGKTLLVGGNDGTSTGIWLQPADGSTARRLELGNIMPSAGYWFDVGIGAQGQIAFTGQTVTDPSELYLQANPATPPVALTAENAWVAQHDLARVAAISWTGPQGKTLNGVLTYPLHYVAGRAYPLALVIHGGPNSASKLRFSLLNQILAQQDILVFEPNYRGSDNMGNDFFAAIYKDAGQGPGEDVMSGVSYLEGRGLVQTGKMAVTGWSYGGFMTTWMLGHYDIWKAGVAGAAVTDWVDMYDLSDSNVTVGAQTGASPYLGDGLAASRAQSPDASVTKIHAPTLVMCNTGDFRVPITQSFGLYRALKDNGVETQFIAYPSGGHFPGDPVRQMDVYTRWADWVIKRIK